VRRAAGVLIGAPVFVGLWHGYPTDKVWHHKRKRTYGGSMSEKQDRDVERVYSTSEFVSKLRRLADALETGKRFEIQVAGERVYVPARAEFNVEHEREGDEEEIEFQLKWTNR
jgi:amphi-Trp domain-containing protein